LNLATHSDVQQFFFSCDLLLQRPDYGVRVAGGFATARLLSDCTKIMVSICRQNGVLTSVARMIGQLRIG
jgi:hypothetical protein